MIVCVLSMIMCAGRVLWSGGEGAVFMSRTQPSQPAPTAPTAAPQIAPYPTSIASLAFSADGALLAAAASYCHERGEAAGAPADQIYVRPVQDAEVRPKPRAAAA